MADYKNLIIPETYNQAEIIVSDFTEKIGEETSARTESDAALQTQIDGNKTDIETNSQAIANLETSKQNVLTAGYNININNNEISCDIKTMSFKGSVDAYADLPSENVTGDVYNVLASNTNYCWNGSEWLPIGTSVDLNGYYTKTEVENLLANTKNILCPVGMVYTQYPLEKSPWELWDFTSESQWQNISSHYADLFPRIAGDNAEEFEKELACTVSGTTITFETEEHGLTTSHIIIDPNSYEQRQITAVSGATVTISSAFTDSSVITSVLIAQGAQLPRPTHTHGYTDSVTDRSGVFIAAGTSGYLYSSNASVLSYKTTESSSGFSSPYVSNGETRPANITVKVWKRIS